MKGAGRPKGPNEAKEKRARLYNEGLRVDGIATVLLLAKDKHQLRLPWLADVYEESFGNHNSLPYHRLRV
ncbi:hypothetical protein A2635_04010 [Candidatus Peribacteria bacterium RIFCSPHIGHO2_01_FULL_51_9]|nr:MAG: hypothetical protein A2635_04010 [Candidatus Peribacteria bacterium RIFCSPHIGHO2_01_FULL_51_9]